MSKKKQEVYDFQLMLEIVSGAVCDMDSLYDDNNFFVSFFY